MAMNYTKSNMFAVPVEIFIAERTVENTAVTLPSLAEVNAGGSATWKHLGGFKEGTIKGGFEPFSEELQDGTLKQTGGTLKMEGEMMETDITKLQLVEGFIDKTIDLIAREVAGTKVHRFQRLGITLGFDAGFSRKAANKGKFVAQRQADKLTTVYDTQTLS